MSDLEKELSRILDTVCVNGNEYDPVAIEELHDRLGKPYTGELVTAELVKTIMIEAIKRVFERDDGDA